MTVNFERFLRNVPNLGVTPCSAELERLLGAVAKNGLHSNFCARDFLLDLDELGEYVWTMPEYGLVVPCGVPSAEVDEQLFAMCSPLEDVHVGS